MSFETVFISQSNCALNGIECLTLSEVNPILEIIGSEFIEIIRFKDRQKCRAPGGKQHKPRRRLHRSNDTRVEIEAIISEENHYLVK